MDRTATVYVAAGAGHRSRARMIHPVTDDVFDENWHESLDRGIFKPLGGFHAPALLGVSGAPFVNTAITADQSVCNLGDRPIPQTTFVGAGWPHSTSVGGGTPEGYVGST